MIDTGTTITIAASGVILTIALNVYNWVKSQKAEAKAQGKEEGSISTKIDSLLHKTDSIASQLGNLEKISHEMNHRLENHEKRLARLERKDAIPGDLFE